MTARALPIRPIRPADQPDVARALGRAFADDPFFSWVIPEASGRARRLARFFGAELRVWMRQGEALTTDSPAGAGLWAPPNRWRHGWRANAVTMPAALAAFGTGSLRAARAWSAVEHRHPKELHWYLAVLGTDPSAQGTGLGSAVVRPVLERCDADGVGAYLETGTTENVSWYERFGFRITEVLERLPGGAPTVWLMWRDPE